MTLEPAPPFVRLVWLKRLQESLALCNIFLVTFFSGTPVGKMFYMAPEIYASQAPYRPFCADIWSCGVMLFIMVTGGMCSPKTFEALG